MEKLSVEIKAATSLDKMLEFMKEAGNTSRKISLAESVQAKRFALSM